MSVVRITRCLYKAELILEKIYELSVGTNEIVRIKRVSVGRGSTVPVTSAGEHMQPVL